MDAAEVQNAPLVGELTREVSVNTVVPLEVFTIRYALAVLRSYNGNRSHAAKALGVSRWAVLRLLKRAAQLGMAE